MTRRYVHFSTQSGQEPGGEEYFCNAAALHGSRSSGKMSLQEGMLNDSGKMKSQVSEF